MSLKNRKIEGLEKHLENIHAYAKTHKHLVSNNKSEWISGFVYWYHNPKDNKFYGKRGKVHTIKSHYEFIATSYDGYIMDTGVDENVGV